MKVFGEIHPIKKQKEYVCLFPFNSEMTSVSLVIKTKGPTPKDPEGQVGKCNGWGGKIEESDLTSLGALQRECQEEMKIDVTTIPFYCFAKEQYSNNALVHYFYCNDDKLYNELLKKIKSEDGDIITVRNIPDILSQSSITQELYVWNVPYLILMAKTLASIPSNLWPIV